MSMRSAAYDVEGREKMEILVFGSTGSIGRQLVEQALAQGHTVTAFTRDLAKLNIKHANLKIVQGNVMEFASVEKAVQGQQAVLCSIGAGRKGTVRSEGTRHIVRAMENAGIRRFICQTSLGVGDSGATLISSGSTSCLGSSCGTRSQIMKPKRATSSKAGWIGRSFARDHL
jgi:putative NADH-flavin reductase